MAKRLCTVHKTINIFGLKICDIWEDYLERQYLSDDITVTEYDTDDIESDNGNAGN